MNPQKPAFTLFVPVALIVCVFFVTPLIAGAPQSFRRDPVPTNVDVSQRSGNESEETVAVNPTNPNNIVIVTNVDFPAAGMFAAVSLDGGVNAATRACRSINSAISFSPICIMSEISFRSP